MISERLKAVAGMVTKGKKIADIGTDHGYVPIYLVENSICSKVYAMDINEGPLKIAGQKYCDSWSYRQDRNYSVKWNGKTKG